MGVVNSTFYVTPDEQSSSEDDEFSPGSHYPTAPNNGMDSKPRQATPHPAAQVILPTYDRTITIEIIAELEEDLDLYEKVSLVYLLYDDPKIALERLKTLQQHQHTKVLVKWAQDFMQSDTSWQRKLLEAFSLIQNYEAVHKLGYETSEAREQYYSFNENASVINGVKRNLYYLCDNLTSEQTDQLLFLVKHDIGKRRKLDVYEEFDPNYLELYITYWMTIEYISPTDLKNLYRILPAVENCEVADNLKLLAPNSIAEERRAVDYYRNEHFVMRDKIQDTEKCYKVDPKSPGICLIINQEHFYTEPQINDSLKHRLALGTETEKLSDRNGTNLDCSELSRTFKEFGFFVKVKNDLGHDQMEEEIENVVNAFDNHSSLIICILSHGAEGMVYGVNSIQVDVARIRNIMSKSNPRLNEKPKILILQSCQGTNLHEITSDGEKTEFIQRDTHTEIVPQTSDMLVFCATVPGYVALRSPQEGSWFIQALCDVILKEAECEHFGDLCTSVVNKVCNKRWRTEEGILIGMIPVLESTLRKKFYLPHKKDQC